MSEPKKRLWAVTLPIAGHAYLEVEADDEKSAIEKACEVVTIDDIESWEALEQFTEGNVCHCPSPWKAEAVDETPDD